MNFQNYLNLCDFKQKIPDDIKLNNIISEIKKQPTKILNSEEINQLYYYEIPEQTNDGVCSRSGKLAKEKFNLAKVIFDKNIEANDQESTLANNPNTQRLWKLNQSLKSLKEIIGNGADWAGIYRIIKSDSDDPFLIKEAYYGEPSRPIFPLDQDFQKRSNNSYVATHGKCRILNDIDSIIENQDSDAIYYMCSAKVKSELCSPIFFNHQIVGIIDVESWQKNYFNLERILQVMKFCFDLGEENIFLKQN
ncbi:free methionine-r-sulfoxide reductase [Anaeramoeba ignava]|uniref:Free methionine-r-sulfoxide reductase n=1 Tax=Anaeramoeba ignava TaxID=1746090 RepID=A0A9Q0RI87_ANAIG|nr:free methionine-r-sulfoxide reductase [Anaeramoeba ignava]